MYLMAIINSISNGWELDAQLISKNSIIGHCYQLLSIRRKFLVFVSYTWNLLGEKFSNSLNFSEDCMLHEMDSF